MHLGICRLLGAMCSISPFGDSCRRPPLGVGDEIQLSYATAMLMDEQSVEAFCMTGTIHDCGDKLGSMKANVAYAIRHTAFGEALKSHLRALLDCDDQSANI